MPSRPSLKTFLATARQTLTAPAVQRRDPLRFVIGNESADLDSLCSALYLAYFRSYAPPKYAVHIPVCNLQREDLRLRPELFEVLDHTGVNEADLITLSDLDSLLPADGKKPAVDGEDTRWILVDHNALTGQLGELFTKQIAGCIDHHVDEGVVPAASEDGPRTIEKVGSCMSLVVEHCRSIASILSANSEGDAQLARVGLAPILIDTNNLKSKDKTTSVDQDAVSYLEEQLAIGTEAGSYSRDKYFERISLLKEDISKLSYRDIFRKDYKQWTENGIVLGMSSVVHSFHYLLEHIGKQDDLLDSLEKWAQEKGLDVAAVMTASDEGNFTRELLIWGLSEAGCAAVEKFVETGSSELALKTWGSGQFDVATGTTTTGQLRICYEQHNLGLSRKRVAPMLRSAMKATSKL